MSYSRHLLAITKRIVRVPYRQTVAYVKAILDGTYLDSLRSPPQSTTLVGDVRYAGLGVIVLDYSLPTPDKDAGSRSVFEHINCLVSFGSKVYFWPLDGIDTPRYASPLAALGVKVIAGFWRASFERWLKKNLGQIAYALVNRPEVAEVYLDTLRDLRIPVVFYGHDLHFARLAMAEEKAGLRSDALGSEAMKARERKIWRRVNVVTYPTVDEVSVLRGLESEVVCRALPAFCYDNFFRRTVAPAGCQLMFVGGFRHTPNVAAAKRLVLDIFPRILAAVPEARLVVAGAYPPADVLALSGGAVEVVGWLSDAELSLLYSRSRVALVPLTFGAGIKLKVVEALFNGTPLVTTEVGAQGLPGIDSMIPVCNDDETFSQAAIGMLQMNDSSWVRQSNDQTQYVEKHFSRGAMRQSLSDTLQLASISRPLE